MRFVIKSSIILSLFFILASFQALAQGYIAHNWYFGNTRSAIKFNKSNNEPNVINNTKTQLGQGGAATATDASSGDLMFYTDGSNIYDAGNNLMPGGGALNGNPAINQPAAIAPVPGEPTKFYVFSNNAKLNPPGIFYAIVDMAIAGNATGGAPALGVVESSNTLLTGVATSEAMLIVSGDNPDQYWLIVQNTTGEYLVFQITAGGILGPQTYNLTGAGAPAIAAGNLAFSQENGKIAVSPQNQNTNVQILNFNSSSGVLSFDQVIMNTGNADFASEAIYDTEWSPDGTKLYISRHGADGVNRGNILQYDLSQSPPLLSTLLNTPVFRSYGLKVGPDGNIYHLYQATNGGPYLLGVIAEPDSIASLVGYNANPLGATNFQGRQFPEFAAATTNDCDVDFEVSNTCANSPVFFTPTFTTTPESFAWAFGDNGTASVQSPTHIYESEGQYQVQLFFSCNGIMDTIAKTINILPNDLQVNIPADTTICPGETLELDATTEGATSYRWSIRDENGLAITTPTVSVDSAGYYWVVVSDGSGCEAYAGSNVKIYGEENRIANIWYFGEGAGIDFNEEPPIALVDGNQINTPEGVAVMSDRNGDLLFYTDGVTVWNRDHQVIGSNIGGSQNATQSALIVPFPEDETLFYIFTTDEVFGDYVMRYSILDIKGNDGLGEILAQNVPLFEKSTERITALGGNPTVLLTHEFGNNTFRAYPITPDGIGNPVLSSIGSPHNTAVQNNGEGYMKFSSDGTKIAVALPGPPNAVELFDYVDSTREVTNFIRLELPDGEFPYGIEFSPSGDMLYVSVNNNGVGPSKLYQYQLENGQTILEDPLNRNEIASGPEAFGALQIGSDQQIYMAVDGASALKQITSPNTNADTTSITLIDFDLGGRTSRLGLPNFIQSIFDQLTEPSMQYAILCVGNESLFSGTGTSDIDEYFWDIKNAEGASVHTATTAETEFIFDIAGTYSLNLSISNRCGFDTLLTEMVEVIGSPPPPPLPSVFAICTGADVIEAAPEGTTGLTYLWSTGDTTRTVVPVLLGPYSVTITNEAGCSSSAETFVFDGRPTVELGPDQIVCQNEPVQLDASYPGSGITWSMIDELGNVTNLNNNTVVQDVNTAQPGIFLYVAEITDPLTSCVGSDTVSITINEVPAFTLTPSEGTNCTADDGSVFYTLSTTGNYTVSWTNSNGVDLGSANPLENLGADIYTLTVTDQVSGCTTSESIGLQDPGGDIFGTITPIPACGGGTIDFEVTAVANFDASYRLFDVTNNIPVPGETGTISTPGIVTVGPLPASTYLLQVTQADGCVKISPETVLSARDSVLFDVEVVESCALPGQGAEVAVSNENITNAAYAWENVNTANPSDGIVNPTSATTFISISGRYRVTVTDADGNLCPSTQEIDVVIEAFPDVRIVPEEDACDGNLRLDAQTSPAGNYSYLWSTGETTPSIFITNPGTTTVTVQVRNRNTGCEGQSSLEVTLQDQLVLQLTNSFACQGEPFTITAESNQQNVIYTWRGPNGNIIENQTSNILIVAADQPSGNYTVIGETPFGCIVEDSRFIDRAPVAPGQLPDRVVICPEDEDSEVNSVLLDPGIYFSYSWVFPDGSTSSASTVVADQAGLYRVTLTNSLGCNTQDSTIIVENCEPEIFGPNAFSPNENGQNDDFSLFTKYLSNFQIFIFNRWGEIVFQSDQVDFVWDGTYKGKIVPVSVYPYRITYTSTYNPERGTLEKRGSVTVVR